MGVYDIITDVDEASIIIDLTTGYSKDKTIARCPPAPVLDTEPTPQSTPEASEVYTININTNISLKETKQNAA